MTDLSRGRTGRLCMEPHPSMTRTFCAVPLPHDDIEHAGPHGWDYESGEKRLITQREIDAQMEASGRGWLVERQKELDGA